MNMQFLDCIVTEALTDRRDTVATSYRTELIAKTRISGWFLFYLLLDGMNS